MGINTGSGNYGELGHGLAGIHAVGTGAASGVYSESSGGTSVYGVSTTGDGVEGESYGSGKSGVYGLSHQADGYGVYGGNWGGGYGVYGGTNSGTGVRGTSSGSNGTGVYGSATATGEVQNYGGYFQADGDWGYGVKGVASGTHGRAVEGHATSTAPSNNYGGHFQADGGTAYGVYAIANGWQSTGVYGEASGPYGTGVKGYGNYYDFYAGGAGTNYGSFTGGHDVKLSEDFPIACKPGLIVSVTGKTQVRRRDDGTITLSSTLPTVKLSKVTKDKAVFGVIVKEVPLPKDHWYENREGERFATVNALGEGRVWVANINGNIEAGDYITTSSVAGYGQRQDDDVLHSYTLGKAIETADWDSVTETVQFEGQIIKVYLIAVVYTSG
jgi:hypothetical protein